MKNQTIEIDRERERESTIANWVMLMLKQWNKTQNKNFCESVIRRRCMTGTHTQRERERES
jgi:hypothetical protein